MKHLFAIIFLFGFIFVGLPCLSFAQVTMEIYDDSSYVSPLRVMLRNSPQPVTAEMKKTLVDFASKERWRFVRDVYPQFQRLDSLFPNEEDRAKIAQNPYAILNPTPARARLPKNHRKPQKQHERWREVPTSCHLSVGFQPDITKTIG